MLERLKMVSFYLRLALCGAFFGCFSFCCSAQEKALNHTFEQAKLEKVLSKIESHFDRRFVYDPSLIKDLKVEYLQLKRANLEQVLRKILHPKDLDYKAMSGRYILIHKKEVSSSKASPPNTKPKDQICGQLVDAEDGTPLRYATIYLKTKKTGTSGNAKGEFDWRAYFNSNDTLIFQYLGYQLKELPVRQLKNKNCQQIALARQKLEIPDVLVEEEAITLIEGAEDGKGSRFLPDKLDVLPGWGDNDLLRIAQLLPGVHSTDESASNLHIRGGTPDQNLILWDGIPIYHSGHFFGMFSAFNPDIVDEMNIYKGDFGARFGDRVSGVIDIKSKPNTRYLDSVLISGGFNMINAYAQAQVPIIKNHVSLLLAARQSYGDWLATPTYKNIFQQLAGRGKIDQTRQSAEADNLDIALNPQLNFSDLNAKIDVVTNSGGEGAISFYQGKDRLSYDILFDQFFYYFNSQDRIEQNNWGLSSNWKQSILPGLTTDLQLIYNEYSNIYRYQHSFKAEVAAELTYFQQNALRDLSLRWQNHWEFAPGSAFNFGVEFNDRKANLELNVDQLGQASNTVYAYDLAGLNRAFYIDYDFHLPKKLWINLGIRRSHNSEVGVAYIEPRFSFDWQIIAAPFHIKGSSGRQVQTISQILQNNELGFGERIWTIADRSASIPEIRAQQSSLGFWYKKNGWLIDVEAYSKKLDQITTLNLRFEDSSDNPYKGGIARMEGVDVLLRKRFGPKLESWLAYTYGRVAYQFESINEQRFFPADHDQRHTLNWTQLWKLGAFSFSSNFTYASGRPFTQATNIRSVPNTEDPSQAPSYEVAFADRNQERLPNYFRLDLSGHYNFQFNNGMKGRLGISILNVSDQFNVAQRRFIALPPNEAEQRPEAQILQIDRELLGRTPNLFFRLEF